MIFFIFYTKKPPRIRVALFSIRSNYFLDLEADLEAVFAAGFLEETVFLEEDLLQQDVVVLEP